MNPSSNVGPLGKVFESSDLRGRRHVGLFNALRCHKEQLRVTQSARAHPRHRGTQDCCQDTRADWHATIKSIDKPLLPFLAYGFPHCWERNFRKRLKLFMGCTHGANAFKNLDPSGQNAQGPDPGLL